MRMPEPDQTALAKRDAVVARLRAIVPGEGVIADQDELRAYECDGLSAYRAVPWPWSCRARPRRSPRS